VHFHAFMQEVQNDLKNLNHEPDPLQKVADRIARQTRLLRSMSSTSPTSPTR
jgi:cell division protein ZapE